MGAPSTPGATGSGYAVRRAAPVVLAPDASASAAFVAVAAECMEHWRANAPAVVTDRDAEALHQTRVGVRRLRSAYALFRGTLRNEPGFVATTTELRARALPLGPARDLDVLVDSPLTAHLGADENGRLRDLRDAAYDTAVDVLASQEWLDLAGRVDGFLADAPWLLRPDPPARAVAGAALQRRWDRVVRRGRRLRRLSAAERHGVRIEAKKLRYGAQFFASLYAAGGADPLAFAELVAGVQDSLGALNDLATTRVVLARIGAPPPAFDEAAMLDHAVGAVDLLLAERPFWR